MVPSVNVLALTEMYAVEPHTSLMKSHTSKSIRYVYTFTSQQGIPGGDKNAEPDKRMDNTSYVIIASPFYPPLQGHNLGIKINDMLPLRQKGRQEVL
jgi:hypothetical protein